MTSMISCIVGKKIGAVASGHLRVISLCFSGYLCVITDGHGGGGVGGGGGY